MLRVSKTLEQLEAIIEGEDISKAGIIAALEQHLAHFDHQETHKYLDQRM